MEAMDIDEYIATTTVTLIVSDSPSISITIPRDDQFLQTSIIARSAIMDVVLESDMNAITASLINVVAILSPTVDYNATNTTTLVDSLQMNNTSMNSNGRRRKTSKKMRINETHPKYSILPTCQCRKGN